MKKKLTLTAVYSLRKEAEATRRRIYVYDTDQPKFGAAFHPSGAVTYFVQYRLRGAGRKGSSKRMTIGSGRDLSPERARALASESIGLVLRGVDVVLQLKEERLKLKEATLKEITEQYFKLEAKPSRHWIDTRALFEHYVFPALGAKPISTVSRQQIRALLDNVRKNGASVERKLFVALRPFFQWAVERGVPEHNPLLGIKPPPPLPARTRYLSPDEIKALWLATEEESWPFQQIYRLFLLTGQRREEVAGMRWEELDLKNALWNLPAIGDVKVTKKRKEQEYQTGRTKNREAHIVNLSRQALAVIDTIPRAEGGFCFSTTGYSSPSGFGKVKARIDARIASLLGKAPTPWVNHDLRRTIATLSADLLGVEADIIERILNHKSTTRSGLKGVYQRQERLDLRAQAFSTWGDYVENLVKHEDVGGTMARTLR